MKNVYTLRTATIHDAYEIWSVMDTCYQAMEHKEHFIRDDLNYVKDILSGHGLAVIACDETKKIVGNLLVKYPGLEEENLGYDVFLKNPLSPVSKDALPCRSTSPCNIVLSPETLNRVIHMDSASVLPSHRGNHLESQMIAFAEGLIDTHRYHYSFATVAPQNTASLKSLEKNGYQVMVTKEKYEGLLRCILMKRL